MEGGTTEAGCSYVRGYEWSHKNMKHTNQEEQGCISQLSEAVHVLGQRGLHYGSTTHTSDGKAGENAMSE